MTSPGSRSSGWVRGVGWPAIRGLLEVVCKMRWAVRRMAATPLAIMYLFIYFESGGRYGMSDERVGDAGFRWGGWFA